MSLNRWYSCLPSSIDSWACPKQGRIPLGLGSYVSWFSSPKMTPGCAKVKTLEGRPVAPACGLDPWNSYVWKRRTYIYIYTKNKRVVSNLELFLVQNLSFATHDVEKTKRNSSNKEYPELVRITEMHYLRTPNQHAPGTPGTGKEWSWFMKLTSAASKLLLIPSAWNKYQISSIFTKCYYCTGIKNKTLHWNQTEKYINSRISTNLMGQGTTSSRPLATQSGKPVITTCVTGRHLMVSKG